MILDQRNGVIRSEDPIVERRLSPGCASELARNCPGRTGLRAGAGGRRRWGFSPRAHLKQRQRTRVQDLARLELFEFVPNPPLRILTCELCRAKLARGKIERGKANHDRTLRSPPTNRR